MREELERVKTRLRESHEFAETTVAREGQNLTAWTNLTASEVAEAVREARLVLSGRRGTEGKRTYRYEEGGFEVDVPNEWSLPEDGAPDGVSCLPDEAVMFDVGPQMPELLPDYTEREFTKYAQRKGYTNLKFGRISAGGKTHVWASYRRGNGEWEKKYLLAFGGIAYVITTTGTNLTVFTQREKVWDSMVASFRLSQSREQDMVKLKEHRSQVAGELYASAYEAVAQGRYSEARTLLERCLKENPDHILAHKELAVVLKKVGDMRGALLHRKEVKRLDPTDMINRFNLADLLAVLGRRGEALQEIEELLKVQPDHPLFLALRAAIGGSPLTYPQHYDEESRRQPGEKHRLELIDSMIPGPRPINLILLYRWEERLSREEARTLVPRAIAYICCAIYDVAINAGLSCQPSPISNGRRPAWILEGERSPVSLLLSDVDQSERTCQMTIGAMLTSVREPTGDRTRWERLLGGFRARFSDICV